MRFYLNCCAGPFEQLLRPYVEANRELVEEALIVAPSLHLLSRQDALFTFDQLAATQRACENPIVIEHSNGHAFPPMTARLQACLLSTMQDVERRADLSDPQAGPLPFMAAGGSPRLPHGTEKTDEPEPAHDSLTFLAVQGLSTMSTRDAVRAHMDFVVIVFVVYHHSRFKFLLGKLHALTGIDREVWFAGAEALMSALMPVALILLGVEAHRAKGRGYARRMLVLCLVLWSLTLSGLPVAFERNVAVRLLIGAQVLSR